MRIEVRGIDPDRAALRRPEGCPLTPLSALRADLRPMMGAGCRRVDLTRGRRPDLGRRAAPPGPILIEDGPGRSPRRRSTRRAPAALAARRIAARTVQLHGTPARACGPRASGTRRACPIGASALAQEVRPADPMPFRPGHGPPGRPGPFESPSRSSGLPRSVVHQGTHCSPIRRRSGS